MKTWLAAAGIAAMVAVGSFSPTRASAACGNQSVHVFDAYWCPYCKLVKEFLAHNNIPYRSIDTTSSARVRAYMAQRFNTTAIPVTVIDDAYVIGFNEPLLRQLLCL